MSVWHGAALVFAVATAGCPSIAGASVNTNQFVTNRPRLFINTDSLPVVVRYAVEKNYDALARIYTDLNRRYPKDTPMTGVKPADHGIDSAEAAFIFLCERTLAEHPPGWIKLPADNGQTLTDERMRWYVLATNLLSQSVNYYRDCDHDNRVVSHYSTTRIYAITAYDWLYDAMPREASDHIGHDLLAHVQHRVMDREVIGDNLGDYRSGFYGELSLPWYVGIATHGTGIDEAMSTRAMAFGYDQQMRMLQYRSDMAGNDGGEPNPALGYSLRAYPWAEFNFFHTMQSAFSQDIASQWPYVAWLPNYALWSHLPGHHEFGAGDSFHIANEFPDEHLYTHLAQIRNFYGQCQPTQAALAAWLQNQCRSQTYNPNWPLMPFLLTDLDQSPAPRSPSTALPLARHFEGVGQIFMHSGWGDDDTYALFTAGGKCGSGKHFDENTFEIYHKGFLALDTGTRPEPGSHLFQYYCRTIAHNGVLIGMDGEKMPRYWGSLAPGEPNLPIANDGGMCLATGAVVMAFRTTPDYTYIASDATACYHPDKCRLAIRQFVHIQPNIFVIFDRIQTTRPDYPVTWLLHTAAEPVISNKTFRADQGEGRLWCETLLPRDAKLTTVGGAGKEFWSDGRNWPLPPNMSLTNSTLFGNWRVEVARTKPDTDTLFLHVIEVGDKSNSTNMTSAQCLRSWHWTGVKFRSGDRTVTLRFRKTGKIACEIGIQGPNKNVDDSLANTVQAQLGLAESE